MPTGMVGACQLYLAPEYWVPKIVRLLFCSKPFEIDPGVWVMGTLMHWPAESISLGKPLEPVVLDAAERPKMAGPIEFIGDTQTV